MRGFRSGISYTNVVATLALFLALSGSAVYAANKITSRQLGKGAVKNKNLAKNAVKKKNLAKNSVTSPKLAKSAVKNANVADGAINFAKLAAGTDVVASATAGPFPAGQEGPIAFNPPLTATPVAGQLLTLNLESRGTVAASGMGPCVVIPLPIVNGNPILAGELLEVVSAGALPIPGFSGGFPVGSTRFPVGMTQPGVPQSIGLFVVSEGGCTPGSTVQVSASLTQAK